MVAYLITKRILDFFIALLLLIALLPVFAVVTLLVAFDVGWPFIFSQERAGFNGRPFRILKFRTMNSERDDHGELLPDEERITNLGRKLRRLSLDELPTLVNVLIGQMSLVGPRPLFLHYIPLYSQRQKLRLSVKPGVTGWAQINGRNNISWQEKFELDIWYVENRSLILDARILMGTVLSVIRRDGIEKEGFATTDLFTGNADD